MTIVVLSAKRVEAAKIGRHAYSSFFKIMHSVQLRRLFLLYIFYTEYGVVSSVSARSLKLSSVAPGS